MLPLPYPARRTQRILVVDEENDLRLLYADVLMPIGYHVDGVEDGAAAWVALCTTRYDLLITENKRPRLTGDGLLRKLHAARMPLPVIVISGMRTLAELDRHPRLGFEAILFKPHTSEELVATVRETLRACNAAHKQTATRTGSRR